MRNRLICIWYYLPFQWADNHCIESVSWTKDWCVNKSLRLIVWTELASLLKKIWARVNVKIFYKFVSHIKKTWNLVHNNRPLFWYLNTPDFIHSQYIEKIFVDSLMCSREGEKVCNDTRVSTWRQHFFYFKHKTETWEMRWRCAVKFPLLTLRLLSNLLQLICKPISAEASSNEKCIIIL